ncbi:MAG: TonB-dependent receptor [Sphingobacteriales bacterium]|nr:MAG: TonB-dependent receptor [Sphingobacteriales bacterium]
MKHIKYFAQGIFTICILLFSLVAQAQTGEIKGTVFDKEKGEPIIFNTVVLVGTGKGAVTDVNGIYNITKIPPGQYILLTTAIGFDTSRIQVSIIADKKVTQNIYLAPISLELKEVQITQKRTQNKTRAEVSKIEVTPRQMQVIPSVGGEPDLAQYLQILPGVISTGDQGGQLYIRGGSPIQNKVLLDGMTIYNPFHSIGLFSVFDVDIIKNVDVYTGGFNAEYGGRISAIMDVTTREGNKGNLSGKFSVSPFTSSVMLEGPLKKFTETGGGASFIVSARSSYLRQSSPVFYPYASKNGLPYNFTDLYGKLSLSAPGGTRASVFGFNFGDDVKFSSGTGYNWKSYGAGAKLLLVPPSSSSIIEANFAYSNYNTTLTEADGKPRFSEIGGFQAGVDLTSYKNDDQIKYGFDINGFKTDFQFFNAAQRKISQVEYTTEIAGYLRYNKVIGRLVLDPSFRLQYYASLGEFSPEPRFAAKYNVTDKFRIKAAGGLFSQNLMSAQSDQDVVNLFYGFLSGPDELPAEFDGREVNSKLQKARHIILGTEIDVAKNMSLQVEGYIKNFNQLTNINRNKIFDDSPEFRNKPEYLRSDYIVETGKAYGVDFLLTYDRQPYYFWATYSLGKVTRFDGREEYAPHWDRRHNINLMGAYQFGKKQSWEFSVRWNYGSGFPFTQTKGFYELLDFQGGINTDYTQENGTLGILFGDVNRGRLSDYHRMDVSLRKTYIFKHDRKLRFVASITNIYDRENVFYFDRVNYERVNQLPFLPSVALSYSF